MGILDSLSSTVNRGTAAAGRKTDQLKLNNQLSKLNRRRKDLAAQLGASLFDVIRANPELREGREEILAEMEALDGQRAEVEAKLTELEAEAQAATMIRCATCGAPMQAGDRFCGSCGAPAAEAMPRQVEVETTVVVDGPTCPSCGAPIQEGDAFCMACGKPIAGEA